MKIPHLFLAIILIGTIKAADLKVSAGFIPLAGSELTGIEKYRGSDVYVNRLSEPTDIPCVLLVVYENITNSVLFGTIEVPLTASIGIELPVWYLDPHQRGFIMVSFPNGVTKKQIEAVKGDIRLRLKRKG